MLIKLGEVLSNLVVKHTLSIWRGLSEPNDMGVSFLGEVLLNLLYSCENKISAPTACSTVSFTPATPAPVLPDTPGI